MSQMVLLRFAKRHAHYPAGAEVWYHSSVAGVMVRAGVAEIVRWETPQRQVPVETMMVAPVAEKAVTRATRKRR